VDLKLLLRHRAYRDEQRHLREAASGHLQDIVLEVAYDAQQYTQREQERALIEVVGAVPNPGPDTVFAKNGVRVATLSDAEILKSREDVLARVQSRALGGVARAPEQDVRRQDVYKEIYGIAREIPADWPPSPTSSRVRWWQSA
jgi:hypothetical protein